MSNDKFTFIMTFLGYAMASVLPLLLAYTVFCIMFM